jgi:hypothetical protein
MAGEGGGGVDSNLEDGRSLSGTLAREDDVFHGIDGAHRAKVDIGRLSIHMTKQRKHFSVAGVSRSATPGHTILWTIATNGMSH